MADDESEIHVRVAQGSQDLQDGFAVGKKEEKRDGMIIMLMNDIMIDYGCVIYN